MICRVGLPLLNLINLQLIIEVGVVIGKLYLTAPDLRYSARMTMQYLLAQRDSNKS